jgi:hypothetical protein
VRSHPADSPRVALLVIGDRGMHFDAELSFSQHARSVDLRTTIRVNDSNHELGFCGALREGMRACRASGATFEYVFHLEEDFTFEQPVSVMSMASILDSEPRVFQVALKRQAMPGEPPGGFMEAWPHAFHERTLFPDSHYPAAWLEHDLFYTTNPNLIRRSSCGLVADSVPDPPRCEETLGRELASVGWRFAYLGALEDEPWVRHHAPRAGRGY